MITLAADKNLKITEVPISNIYTQDGSTLNPIRHGIDVLGRIVVMISQRRPLLVFGLAGGILLVIGLIFGFRVINVASATGQPSHRECRLDHSVHHHWYIKHLHRHNS